MSDDLEHGGPAFPGPAKYDECGNPESYQGMKLRDYFAAKAMNLFSLDNDEVAALVTGKMVPQHELTAKFCYDLADAMLKARM